MTFKHTTFEDSSTMRSLVKLAKEKGWVKDEPMQKTVAPKLDLTPSESFTENLLKLCAGLRASGFDKQAEEIETKFVQYKQANSLYGVGNEKGEDLVHAAHPKGSHKMEDIDSKEATFEDILDHHLKMMEVVEKKPTGKYANTKDILGAVKTVLAQSANVQSLLQTAYGSVYAAYQLAAKAGGLTGIVLNWTAGRVNTVGEVAKKSESDLTSNDIDDAVSAINAIQRNLHPNALHNIMPEFLNKGISDDSVWAQINDKLEAALKNCNTALEVFKSQALSPGVAPSGESKPLQLQETQVSADPVIGRLAALSNKLKAYQVIPAIAKNRDAVRWIKEELADISGVMHGFSNVPEGQEDTVKPQFEKEVARLEGEVSQFATTWLSA